MVAFIFMKLTYNLQSSGIGAVSSDGTKEDCKTKLEIVSKGPVFLTRLAISGLGISEFDNFEMRAFLIIPLAVSSIQPHLTFVGSLIKNLINEMQKILYFLIGSIRETFATEIGCSMVIIEPFSDPVYSAVTCLFT